MSSLYPSGILLTADQVQELRQRVIDFFGRCAQYVLDNEPNDDSLLTEDENRMNQALCSGVEVLRNPTGPVPHGVSMGFHLKENAHPNIPDVLQLNISSIECEEDTGTACYDVTLMGRMSGFEPAELLRTMTVLTIRPLDVFSEFRYDEFMEDIAAMDVPPTSVKH